MLHFLGVYKLEGQKIVDISKYICFKNEIWCKQLCTVQKYQEELFMQLVKSTIYSHNPSFIYSWLISHILEREFFYLGQLHSKYIDRKYYDILLCLIYHRNLVVICAADCRIQPMIVPSTTIPWFQPLIVVCQSRFIVEIGIKV